MSGTRLHSPRRAFLLGSLAAIAAAAAGRPPADNLRRDAQLDLLSPDGAQTLATIVVEIADRPASWRRGLMGRLLPDDDRGMLFVYPDSAHRTFWMRNTPAALDILFADAAQRVVDIVRNAAPLTDTRHVSTAPARFVIEVRGGFAARHRISEGCWFRFRHDPDPRAGNIPPPRCTVTTLDGAA